MFFQSEREHFFRPLTGKYRELVVTCLRMLYERLNGPSADYAQNLTRDSLRDLLSPLFQSFSPTKDGDDDSDPLFNDGDEVGNQVSALIRKLVHHGWMETFGDRAGLVTAYRFTRAGKLFSEALWSLDRLRNRSRQRNVRSCRNALEAALRTNDAYDLVDAYDYAERVVSDLSEGVDYFQQLVRKLMAEASQTPWDEFMEFLDRFERDFKKQLTADNVERHRQMIREAVDRLRGIEEDTYQAMERQLADVAMWAIEERGHASSTYHWLLDRIEEMVEVACNTKNPELIRSINLYMRRATSIVQQAMFLQGGQTIHSYARVIGQVATLEGEAQDRLLSTVGEYIASAEVRLLDPASFKLRTLSERRKAVTLNVRPKVSREARLEAVMNAAEDGAFTVSNDDVLTALRLELRMRNKPFRLSHLSFQTATDVLKAMQSVEAIRTAEHPGLKVTRLPTRFDTEGYSGNDYEIEPQ